MAGGIRLTVNGTVVVDVGITQGAARDGIAADADGSHRPHLAEELIELRLSHLGIKVAHVQGRRGRG